MSGYYLLKRGEFAYNKSYSVGYDFGSIKRLDRYSEGALSTLYICFELTQNDPDFMKVYFDSLKWYKEIYMIAAEGARNHGLLNVPTVDFFDTRHTLPRDVKEQQKIARFMLLLEKRIEKQRQLVETLKLYKRGALSKLFPQKGETTPRYRFAGFTEPWNLRKLSELGSIVTGTTPPTAMPQYYSEDGIPWVTPTDITENVTTNTERKLSPLGQQVGRIVPANTILVTCIASIGKNTMLGTIGSFNQQINGLTPDENKYDPYFLLTESALWSIQMKRMAAAGTMQIVNRTEFSEMETWIPEREEQQTIGGFFQHIDHLITIYQQKFDMLQRVKSALLQQLFM